jgi:hypothetical protein
LPASAADIAYSVPSASFSTIQAAIDAAKTDSLNSHTITVAPGTYGGGITISALPNSLILKGRETARTVISGGASGTLLTITGNTVGMVIQNLLFRSAADAILVSNNTGAVTVQNNIFAIGSANTGVTVQTSNATVIQNNTFYQNETAVVRDIDAVIIRNNIFSTNAANIHPSPFSQTNISNNLHDPTWQIGDLVGTDPQPDGIEFTNSDPDFVDAASLDFHIASDPTDTSAAIDNGSSGVGSDSADGTDPDIGAYGGPNADTIPSIVTNVSSTALSTTSVRVSWSPNPEYRVAGYKVYYGFVSRGSGSYDSVEMVSGATSTSTVISGLTTTVDPPAKPTMAQPEPRDRMLKLSWSEADGATSYTVHYSLASAPSITFDVPNITGTSYDLRDLVNYEVYNVSVTAVAQATLYSAVTASYPSTCSPPSIGPGVGCESAYSTESQASLGASLEGEVSNIVEGIPEPIIAYPDLPNTGCFIATAAYGSSNAAPVRILREFRDRRLLTNGPGRTFVRWYYRASPALARYMNDHPLWKPVVRAALGPVVAAAMVLTYAPWVIFPAAVAPFLLRRALRRRAS